MNPDEIRKVFAEAAALTAGLPSELRSVAFGEALRLMGHTTTSDVLRGDSPAATAPTELPSASVVKQRGSRTQKVLYAIATLEAEGKPVTSIAVEAFLKQRLAFNMPKVTDVLRGAVPEYLRREKAGAMFVYAVTPSGMKLVQSLDEREGRQ